MDRYVAFLRGMNLGNRRLKNDELRAEFERLGFDSVATFRASGNVIFDSDGGGSEAALTKAIEAGLGEGLGYEVPVFLRSAAEVAAIAAHEPFEAKPEEAGRQGPQGGARFIQRRGPARDRGARALLAAERRH